MRRVLTPAGTLLCSLLLAALAALVTRSVYNDAAALDVFKVLAAVGIATTVLTSLLAARRRAVGGLRRQFALAAAVAIAALLAATGLFVDLMFVSHHDAFFTGVVAVYAGLLNYEKRKIQNRVGQPPSGGKP